VRPQEIWAIGREAHPAVEIAVETFASRLGDVLPGLRQIAAHDVEAHAADIYLVAGCLLGVPAALSVLERDYLARVPRFVARIDRRPEFAQEVAQLLRERLLSPESRKLADYAAAGPLVSWLRVSARRLAIDLQRRAGMEARHVDASPNIWEVVAAAGDPENDVLRGTYREPLQLAIQHGIAGLSPRERMVLRLYLFGGQNIEQIGKTYEVHRATVARWIVAAEEKIVAAVRAELGARFGITEGECDSLARGLRSTLNVSLSGVL
jgi:RNA polymerase sigma-70 factor (ECF subfamily)